MHVSPLATPYSSSLQLFISKSFLWGLFKNFREGEWITTLMERSLKEKHWYVSNVSIIFDAPCFFFTPFALCFVTLRGVFMRFPELTYWQDATVPVPYFLLFLCFRKATQEIFSELHETSSETPIFSGRRTRTKREPEAAHTIGGRGPDPGHAHPWWGRPGPPLTMPLPYKKHPDGKS
jgi:hypothetical protein